MDGRTADLIAEVGLRVYYSFVDLDLLRPMHARAVSSLESFRNSGVASDREAMAQLAKFEIMGGYLRDIGRVLSGEIAAADLDFVDQACDMRGLYWDTPATLLEREALDDAASLFLRLRDELANPASNLTGLRPGG